MAHNPTSFEEYPKNVNTDETVKRIIEIRDRDKVQLEFMSKKLSALSKGASNLYLTSPNGTVWEITIDNSGNLIRTAL